MHLAPWQPQLGRKPCVQEQRWVDLSSRGKQSFPVAPLPGNTPVNSPAHPAREAGVADLFSGFTVALLHV